MHDVAALLILVIACAVALAFGIVWVAAILLLARASWKSVARLNREKGWFQ